jgi:D-xylose transport system substrate-binding protein
MLSGMRVLISALTLSALVALCGCGPGGEPAYAVQGERPAAKIKIGFSMSTLREERWQRDRDIFVARAKELGADVIVQNANNDSDEQQRQVKYLLDQGIDILVIVPHDAIRASVEVQQAKKQGIRVISYDRLVLNADVDLYISFDNVRVGELMAESLVKQVPAGNYVIINGAKTDNNCYMFNKGYKNVLKSYVDRGDIKIISEVWARDWMHEDAFNCIESTLQSGQTIDAVIAANDSLAAAAIEALSEKRLAGKIPVAGHDADLSGCQRVAEGTQLMTIYKPIHKIAKRAAEIAIEMARGEKIEANRELSDGKYIVPYYMIQPIAVTRDNLVDTVIKDSFHRLEDIYMNVPRSQWPSG